MSERFEELRDRIAENDRAIVAGVNLRLRLVAELWRIKEEQGAALLDPDREQLLRAALAATNEGPLSDAGARPPRQRAPRVDEARARAVVGSEA